jgi:endonuclease YncB( thermonuclease family)
MMPPRRLIVSPRLPPGPTARRTPEAHRVTQAPARPHGSSHSGGSSCHPGSRKAPRLVALRKLSVRSKKQKSEENPQYKGRCAQKATPTTSCGTTRPQTTTDGGQNAYHTEMQWREYRVCIHFERQAVCRQRQLACKMESTGRQGHSARGRLVDPPRKGKKQDGPTKPKQSAGQGNLQRLAQDSRPAGSHLLRRNALDSNGQPGPQRSRLHAMGPATLRKPCNRAARPTRLQPPRARPGSIQGGVLLMATRTTVALHTSSTRHVPLEPSSRETGKARERQEDPGTHKRTASQQYADLLIANEAPYMEAKGKPKYEPGRPTWRKGQAYAAYAIRAIDGDTILVAYPYIWLTRGMPNRIRLAGINAPELRPKAQPGAVAAKYALSCLVQKQDIIVVPTRKWPDKYGRLIARVFNEDREDVSAAMIRSGYATEYRPKAKGSGTVKKIVLH